ncbi:M23 family metallopeptidase [Acaryochloris marina]|uniref:M23 family metallopeptidase n=1 Tax=Acaryochloris marina TaxID=155978 RepID=UPI001BAFEEC0|nr:M23 family metallopeptidase [Acaryochloris marina]QUY46150.1 M23 family metallopeptidase [Acaryochloris marina S15]
MKIMNVGIPFGPIEILIAPPMDLNRSTTPEPFSTLPLRLRTNDSLGLFGVRRASLSDGGLARIHEGVDLLADEGEPVFAVADGRVILINDIPGGTIIAIQHDPLASGIISRYLHLRNPLVNINQTVVAGEQIAEVGPLDAPEHLHFEMRWLPEMVVPLLGNSENSYPLDPTRALYNLEKNRFPNNQDTRRVGDRTQIRSISEIVRDRMLHFVRVRTEGSTEDVYLPIFQPSPDEESLLEMLRMAFSNQHDVRLVWRDSLFFSDIQSTDDFVNVLVEVQVFG